MVSRALAAVVLGPRWPSPTPAHAAQPAPPTTYSNPWPAVPPAARGPVLYDRERSVMA